ncbi:hypothetical protein AGMMS50230_09430 [Spirochaetia bacterium]|nr:hypothetical protein AGMMS50230_09430 [Spirochaetia bacterium]
METGNLEKTYTLAVLVPHRDCLPALELYRRSLFAAGLDGAFSFPAAAPLAVLERPLPQAELKAAAAELRSLLGNRKITVVDQTECSGWSPGIRFFGPILDLPPPVFPGTLQRWEQPVLAPAILAGTADSGMDAAGFGTDAAGLPETPKPALSFRAAALAQLRLTPSPCGAVDYSFIWELSPLCWLPRPASKH